MVPDTATVAVSTDVPKVEAGVVVVLADVVVVTEVDVAVFFADADHLLYGSLGIEGVVESVVAVNDVEGVIGI